MTMADFLTKFTSSIREGRQIEPRFGERTNSASARALDRPNGLVVEEILTSSGPRVVTTPPNAPSRRRRLRVSFNVTRSETGEDDDEYHAPAPAQRCDGGCSGRRGCFAGGGCSHEKFWA